MLARIDTNSIYAVQTKFCFQKWKDKRTIWILKSVIFCYVITFFQSKLLYLTTYIRELFKSTTTATPSWNILKLRRVLSPGVPGYPKNEVTENMTGSKYGTRIPLCRSAWKVRRATVSNHLGRNEWRESTCPLLFLFLASIANNTLKLQKSRWWYREKNIAKICLTHTSLHFHRWYFFKHLLHYKCILGREWLYKHTYIMLLHVEIKPSTISAIGSGEMDRLNYCGVCAAT